MTTPIDDSRRNPRAAAFAIFKWGRARYFDCPEATADDMAAFCFIEAADAWYLSAMAQIRRAEKGVEP